jgi:hypothetical protein
MRPKLLTIEVSDRHLILVIVRASEWRATDSDPEDAAVTH